MAASRVCAALACLLLASCGGGGGGGGGGAAADPAPLATAPVSAPNNQSASRPASLLFWSGFETSTVLAAPTDCYANGCWQRPSGVDANTGSNWASGIWGNAPAFQMIENSATSATPANIGSYIVNQIVSTTGHKGTPTQALAQTIAKSGCNGGAMSCDTGSQGDGSTQDPLMFLSNADIPEAYVSKWVYLQPDLMTAVMSSPTWIDLFEWKTPDPIDYRFQVAIQNYSGGAAHWMTIGDAYAPSYTEFWRVYADNVPVPLGRWFKLEVYWKRAPDASGRFWAAVDGQVILDRPGANYGVRADHIDRVMAHQVYTGGSYPFSTTIDDLQVWNTWPAAAAGDTWYDPPYAPH